MPFEKPLYLILFNLVFFLVFMSLAVVHIRGLIRFDAISLVLIALSLMPIFLPYIKRFIRSIEAFGMKIELIQQMEEKIDEQGNKIERQQKTINDQQETINTLVKYGMSASIFKHLCGIALLHRYTYHDSQANRREMYFLRDNGFIAPKTAAFIDFDESMDQTNLVEKTQPTPIGWEVIKLRKAEIPSEMIHDTDNLRVALENL